MSELLQIKKRINSIHKINKITNVMEIISISKTAKLKQLFLNNIDFQNNLYKCIAALKINDTNSSQVKLWVVFSGSLGMAGNYNINTFKKIKENIKTNDKIIVFGERGYKFVKKETMKYEDTLNIKTEEKHFAFFEYKYVSDYIARLYLLNKIGSLSLIYTKYKDNKIKTDVVEVLPITKEFNEQNKNEVLYNFEQDTKHIFKKILPFYLESIIYSALIESKLSENIARKNAMVEANNNIEENIRELSIKYNKKRQEKITSESERRVNND